MATTNKRIILLVAAVALVLVGIIGYRIYDNLTSNKERAGRVSQGRAVAVEIAPVTRKDITPELAFSANLDPLWSAEISAKVDGRIDRLLVEEGDFVKAGTLIAALDTAELAAQVAQAEGTLLSNKANLEQADLDLRRTEALFKQGAVSVQALDTARIKRDLAVGQVRSAEGNLALLTARMENANVVAPRDGVVVKRHLQAGFYTKTGSPIVTLADASALLAKATVGEAQVSELSVGTKVKVLVSALGNTVYEGVITRISPAAALPARTFTAEITVANAQAILKPGMFAKVSVPGQLKKNVVVVPESALVMKEDQKSVYVVTPEGQARQTVLQLGYVGDGWAEVLNGVKDGDKIVVAGQNKLKDGMNVSVGAKAGGN